MKISHTINQLSPYRLQYILSTILILTLISSAVLAQGINSAKESPMEWREVFWPDGTITIVEIPRQIDPPLDQRTIAMATEAEVVALQETGPSAERYDLVFVGDGYTESQIPIFHQHVANLWARTISFEPFATYQDFFNIWMANVVSNESGVSGNPIPSIVEDTALDMPSPV